MNLRTLVVLLVLTPVALASPLKPADSEAGYVARLLINEAVFPGERGWISEADSREAMLSILWVLHARVEHIPKGYRQQEVAAIRASTVLDVITAGGVRGQCDGFYRDESGGFRAVPRVHERVERLVQIAGQGEPGRFARLLAYAQSIADAYLRSSPELPDRFERLDRIEGVEVTGRGYAWMTNINMYSPGGDFVRITDQRGGAAGGNRFFTLRRRQ